MTMGRLQALREQLSGHDVDVEELREKSKRAWGDTYRPQFFKG